MGKLIRGLSEAAGVRVVFADVTDVAREAEQRHLAGPAAGQVLAQALTGAALLGADRKSEDESVMLQMRVEGPVEGLVAESWGEGLLRGYPHRKLLDELDGREEHDPAGALGAAGTLVVHRSTPEKTLFSGTVPATPPDIRLTLARYFHHSLQSAAAVALDTVSGDTVERAVGVFAEKLPGGDTERFVTVLTAFNDGAVQRALRHAQGIVELADVIGLPDLAELSETPLAFGCRCSDEKVMGILAALPLQDREEIATSGESQSVTCHFCGHTYTITPDRLRELSN